MAWACQSGTLHTGPFYTSHRRSGFGNAGQVRSALTGHHRLFADVAAQRFSTGTLGWLGTKYFVSDEFQALDPKSQRNRRNILESCFAETSISKEGRPVGFCPLHLLTSQTIKALRDLKKDKPGAANNRRKYLSSMFGWAIEQSPPLMKTNPARDVRRIKYETEGFHTWTPQEFAQFEARHPLGTKAHLALALLLFTGTRRGDMVTLGRQHVRDGWLRFVPSKGRKQTKTVVLSEKPWLPVLEQIVKTSPCGDLTFLVTEYGKPFTAAGFGNWFRDRCNEADLPQCTAHGLRKMGATRAAENGATEHQLMAIFDWKTPGQARTSIQRRPGGKSWLAARWRSLKRTLIRTSIVAPTILRLSHLSKINRLGKRVAGVEGLEPPTPGFGDRCSGQLSYTPNPRPRPCRSRDATRLLKLHRRGRSAL